jgi:hypothetical protein
MTVLTTKEEAMRRAKARRAPLGVLFALALGGLALLALPSLAAARDRNHDHIPDRWEKRHHLSLTVNQAHRDQDRDGLRNLGEFKAGDNPRDADTDGDGVPDGEENAGTVASFDTETGKLTISLFGGETIGGLVTEETEIQCEGEGSAGASSSDEAGSSDGHDGEEAGSEDNGGEGEPGGDEGEDNGGAANCTAANLVPGAVVHQAELEVANGTATFHEVELTG